MLACMVSFARLFNFAFLLFFFAVASYLQGHDGSIALINSNGTIDHILPSLVFHTPTSTCKGLLPLNRVTVLSDEEGARLRTAALMVKPSFDVPLIV